MTRRRDSPFYRATRWCGGVLGAALLRALGATWRIELRGPDPFAAPGPLVLGTWHGGLLIAAVCWRDRGLVIPVSQSRDGDWIDAVLRRLGFAESARGSSSRGATALLRALIRRIRAGEAIGMLPDGPRGPSGVVQGGVVLMAKKSGAALVACGVSASHKWHVPTWDSYMLPWPFARCVLVFGDPIFVSKDASDGEVEAARGKLEAEIHRVQKSADDWFVKRR